MMRRNASSQRILLRPVLDADNVPTLPVYKGTGDHSRARVGLRSIDTTSYPDVTSMVDAIMCNDERDASDVAETSNRYIVRTNVSSTTAGIVAYVNSHTTLCVRCQMHAH